jgi:hypothetical protein
MWNGEITALPSGWSEPAGNVDGIEGATLSIPTDTITMNRIATTCHYRLTDLPDSAAE